MRGGGYASRVVSTRTPSGAVHTGMRGRLPVHNTMMSAWNSSEPFAVSARTVCASSSVARPRTSSTLWLISNSVMDRSSLFSMPRRRVRRRSMSISERPTSRPMSSECAT